MTGVVLPPSLLAASKASQEKNEKKNITEQEQGQMEVDTKDQMTVKL